MNYNWPMGFDWDEFKSNACFRERGFYFAYAAQVFFDLKRMVRQDTRRDYGEDRFQVMGDIDGRLFVVVYTTRYYVIRIFSARKADQREVQCYENRTNQN